MTLVLVRSVAVRIATYNVHSGIGRDGKFSLERIGAVLREIDADVVCVQEMDRNRRKTGRVDQPAILAATLGAAFHFHATIRHPAGEFGDAIFSRHPFSVVRATTFPDVPRPVPWEQRGAIWIEADIAGQRWQIINTHLGLGYRERRLQAQHLAEDWIKPATLISPTVVCGDLNSRPASQVHQIMGLHVKDVFRMQKIRHPATFSTRLPVLCLDYIFVSEGVEVQRAARWDSALARQASDHFPVIAEVIALQPIL